MQRPLGYRLFHPCARALVDRGVEFPENPFIPVQQLIEPRMVRTHEIRAEVEQPTTARKRIPQEFLGTRLPYLELTIRKEGDRTSCDCAPSSSSGMINPTKVSSWLFGASLNSPVTSASRENPWRVVRTHEELG